MTMLDDITDLDDVGLGAPVHLVCPATQPLMLAGKVRALCGRQVEVDLKTKGYVSTSCEGCIEAAPVGCPALCGEYLAGTLIEEDQ